MVFDPMLLIALCVPSAASAATAKYQVAAVRPVISYVRVDAPLTTTDFAMELCEVP